jgi:hypothetical protein
MADRKCLILDANGLQREIPAGDTLQVAGLVESTSSGFKFPDGTIQTESAMSARNFKNNAYYAWDFAYSGAAGVNGIWNSAAVSSGTISVAPPTTVFDLGLFGVQTWRSSATNNSGWSFRTGGAEILLRGGEVTRCILAPRTTSIVNTIRFGFTDSGTSSAPTDGAVFEITASNALIAANYNNGVMTPSGAIATLSDSTFYELIIVVNSNATSIDYLVYAMGGSQVGSTVSLPTGIPTASGRLTGHGIVATNSGAAANDICYVDFIDLYLPGRQRGRA